MKKNIHIIFITQLFLLGCSVVKDAPKYAFAEGYYHSKLFRPTTDKVYIENTKNAFIAHPVLGKNKQIDSSHIGHFVFPEQQDGNSNQLHTFKQGSFDFDFLTIPFKYRPSVQSFPRQFNTNLNGAIYLGYRNDIYRIGYQKNPLNIYNRQTTHYGFSFGFFSGLGGTAINPSVTVNQVSAEYDGVVWSKGFAGIVGIDNFTLGLSLGWDHLLDGNRNYWLYNNKPWVGLVFGLNLN